MKECCKDTNNRIVVSVTKGETATSKVERCRTCGAKHYRIEPIPLAVGTKGAAI